MREIARALDDLPQDGGRAPPAHLPKIGVTTRSGATLYAIEHGLLPSSEPFEGGELPVATVPGADEAGSNNSPSSLRRHIMSDLLSMVQAHYDALNGG